MSIAGRKVALVVAPVGFRDEEYLEPRQVLVQAGAVVHTASSAPGTAKGKLGATAKVDLTLDALAVKDYQAVLFIGGPGAADYFTDARALRLAAEAVAAGKVVGAICIAPGILARAGLLKGRKATCFSSEEATLKKAGATCTGRDVEVDGRLVTATGPAAAKRFGEAVAKLLEAG